MKTRRAELRAGLVHAVREYVGVTMVYHADGEVARHRAAEADRAAHDLARRYVELHFHEQGMRAQKRQRGGW